MSSNETSTLDEYQQLAMRTSPSDPTDHHGLVELVSEVGEVASLMKRRHHKSKDGTMPLQTYEAALTDELGDILWSVAYIAGQHGISLRSIANFNIAKLARRWGPGGRPLVPAPDGIG